MILKFENYGVYRTISVNGCVRIIVRHIFGYLPWYLDITSVCERSAINLFGLLGSETYRQATSYKALR